MGWYIERLIPKLDWEADEAERQRKLKEEELQEQQPQDKDGKP